MSEQIFFTADTHFNHTNIIKYCNRPFSDTNHMNQTMIDNWNRVVRENDLVYHLGDFGFRDLDSIMMKLNGHIILILGSHDKRIERYKGRFSAIIPGYYSVNIKGYEVTLSHYAMRVWPKSHYGAWHLYGHSHGNLESFGKSFDVGVETHNFTPYILDEVVAKMNQLPDNFNLVKDGRRY